MAKKDNNKKLVGKKNNNGDKKVTKKDNNKNKIKYSFGWKPSIYHISDPKQEQHLEMMSVLPSSVDLRSTGFMPPIYQQASLGSCTSQAGAALAEYLIKKEHHTDYTPSRLFIYYYERVLEHSVGFDSGASLRDCIVTLSTNGAPREALWPYSISKFKIKPPASCNIDGQKHRISQYFRVNQDLNSIKSCIFSGFPIILGIVVYSSFLTDEVANSGVVNLPNPNNDTIEGGHAILICSYDDATQKFTCRNSWGVDWGMNGYFTLPYSYVLNHDLSSDLWSAKFIS